MIFQSRYRAPVVHKDVLSYVFDDPPYPANHPLFVDVSCPTHILTFQSLQGLTKLIGNGLRKDAAVKAGDVVLTCMPNRLWSPALWLGILCAGAVASGANPSFTEGELIFQLQNTGAKVVICVPASLDVVLRCCEATGISRSQIYVLREDEHERMLEKFSGNEGDSGQAGEQNHMVQERPFNSHGVKVVGNLLTWGEMDWNRITDPVILNDRLAALNYSSGTTGLPKGCMISHFNVVACSTALAFGRAKGNEALRSQGQGALALDRYRNVSFLPYYHAIGQQFFILNTLKMGDTTYIMTSFSLPSLLEVISKHKLNNLALVPPVAVQLAKSPLVPLTDLSSLVSAFCGAAPLGKDGTLAAQRALDPDGKKGLKLTQVYGMSEMTLTATIFNPGEWDQEDISGVGHLQANMQAKILNDEGKELGYESEGELWLRGPNLFRGYWRNERATREAITQDGWYRTGDIGVMKKTGIVHIVDRKKELIKVNAYQVAPAELEDTLLKHPDVADAAVIGITIEGTELPRAYIVPTKPLSSLSPSTQQSIAQSITQFIATNLVYYKQLKGGIVFVEEIPKSSSGKILRRIIRERAKAEMDVENDHRRPIGAGATLDSSATGTQTLSATSAATTAASAPADNLNLVSDNQGATRTNYVEPRGHAGFVKAKL